jgi:hypothetical protein
MLRPEGGMQKGETLRLGSKIAVFDRTMRDFLVSSLHWPATWDPVHRALEKSPNRGSGWVVAR